MCENSFVLILLLIMKIVFIVLIPVLIILYIKRKLNQSNKLLKTIVIGEILLLIIFVIIKLFLPTCFSNSKIRYLNGSSTKKITAILDTDIDIKAIKPEFYKNYKDKNVYYYNNSKIPLSYVKINSCDKNIYFKHYGKNASAISSAVSTVLDKNIDPIEIINKSISNNIFSCENGVNSSDLMNLVSKIYGVSFNKLQDTELVNNIKNGDIILAEIEYNDKLEKNITCDNSFIIIYNMDNNDDFVYLNTNKRNDAIDYICPEDTKGEYSLIKSNNTISSSDLKIIGKNYYLVKRGE